MSTPRIGRMATRISVDKTRIRQTPRVPSTFGQILKGGAQVLVAGAATATRVVGLPSMSAAISRARISRTDPSAPALGGGSGSSSTSADPMKKLLDRQMTDNVKLLKLQSEIQQRNREVALVSNVMKARHDTAKSAISNMRA